MLFLWQCIGMDELELRDRLAALRDKTLGELASVAGVAAPEKQHKGWTGMLLEKVLGATAGSRSVPDFEALGIELKSVPIDSKGQPLESTFVASLDLAATDHRWDASPVRKKLARVAWVLVSQERIANAFLWSPSPEEEAQVRDDYEEIIDLVEEGFAVDARVGVALQLRPKGRNAAHLRWAVNEEGERSRTPPRAFYLRRSFTHRVLLQAGK
jgi:DNA mismatch repair protein MutH